MPQLVALEEEGGDMRNENYDDVRRVFTTEQKQRIVANLTYCGLGPMKAMVSEDDYMESLAILIIEEGIEMALKLVKEETEKVFGPIAAFGGDAWVPAAKETIDKYGLVPFMKGHIEALRQELANFPLSKIRTFVYGYAPGGSDDSSSN